jgi:diacylglycerol kinase family enzyme
LVRNLRLLYNGEIYRHPKVKFFRVMSIRADSTQTALIEIDGEPLGRLPVEISIVPRAIRLLS